MNLPDPRIVKFLKEHHVLTLATCSGQKPWCVNCYYVYLENEAGFVFTSDLESRHIQEALANTSLAGAIVLETSIPGKIQGVQFEGKLKIADQVILNKAKNAYLKRYPMTSFLQTDVWYAEVSYIKYSDNRLVPINKLYWKR